MKILSVGEELFLADGQTHTHTDGRTDGRTDTTNLKVPFRNFGNALRNCEFLP
jgi:hypothetical protein